MPEKPASWPEEAPRPALLTDDPLDVLRFLVEALAQGIGAALVTLVDIRGGSARTLGAQMGVRADGLFCGQVSGGCVEAAVAREAMMAIAQGSDRFLHLGEGSPFFDIRLPCGGGIRLAIHVLRDGCALTAVLARLALRQPAALRYEAHDQRLVVGAVEGRAGWRGDQFLWPFRPPVCAMIAGRPMERDAVLAMAVAASYEIAPDESDATPDADTAVVLLQHDLDREMPMLLRALESPAFYIGALGSARTHERRCIALRERGVGETQIARIRAPIGLFPKARDARSLALSVVAEIASVRTAFLEGA